MNISKTLERGTTLVEILIALSMIIVLISIASVALVTSLSNAEKTKMSSQAQKLAQQGIEIARQLRDSSWQSFDNYNGLYCLAGGSSQITIPVGNCNLNVDGKFTRQIVFERTSNRCNSNGRLAATRVTSIVSWTSSRCTSATDFCESVSAESCFANIYGDVSL